MCLYICICLWWWKGTFIFIKQANTSRFYHQLSPFPLQMLALPLLLLIFGTAKNATYYEHVTSKLLFNQHKTKVIIYDTIYMFKVRNMHNLQ